MRISTISKIINYADIIESFVRYHAEIVDDIYLIENGSTDGTLSILRLLKREGYPITIFDETDSEFDELRFINQYTEVVLKSGKIDWLIPIDVDEFLYAGGRNPRKYMENWKTDTVYTVMWRTYIWKSDIEEKKGFVPDRYNAYRDEKYETYTKVIIPGHLYGRKKLLISKGNHDVIGIEVKKKRDSVIKFAHYPVRSKEQFKAQIVVNAIMQISRLCKEEEAWHWSDMYRMIKEKKELDLERISAIYAMKEKDIMNNSQMHFCDGRISHSFLNNMQLRYEQLAKISAFDNLMYASEQLAKKITTLHLEKSVNDCYKKKKLIIYGVGGIAYEYANAINKDKYDIIGYAVSDIDKNSHMFQGREVVQIEDVHKLDADCIVIASCQYFDEMKAKLLDLGFSEEICFIIDILYNSWQDRQIIYL